MNLFAHTPRGKNREQMLLLKIFLLTSLTLMTTPGFANQKQPTVVIIGAGLAGLTTAYRLQQKGIVADVYEARGRTGGRIFTAKIGSDVVELGGQNITDGGDAENIGALIEEFRLETTETKVTRNHQYFDGEKCIPESDIYKKKFTPETLKAQLDLAAQKAHNIRDVILQFVSEEDPLFKVLTMRLAGYEGGPIEKLSTLYTVTLYYMLLGGLCSVHQGIEEAEFLVNIVSIKGGNNLLSEKLAQSLGTRLHLNRPLTAIAKAPDQSYELLFQNGQKVKADILVLAIPCSVYDAIRFEENLIPKERLASIRNVQYGTNAKILVPFAQLPPKNISFINDHMGCFFADQNVITLYFTGESGKFSENTIFDVYKRERSMLEVGFGALCPPLATPTYARDEAYVTYTGPVGYSWPNDPYAKGTYSYIAAGQEALLTSLQNENGETVKTLFAPIDETLYFAGEHASILMEVPGTMEAACESGERTARMIAKCINSL